MNHVASACLPLALLALHLPASNRDGDALPKTPQEIARTAFAVSLEFDVEKRNSAHKHERASRVQQAFLVAPDLAVTAAGGLGGVKRIEGRFEGGKPFVAQWIGVDRDADLALLRLDPEKAGLERPPVPLDRDATGEGEWAIVYDPRDPRNARTVPVADLLGEGAEARRARSTRWVWGMPIVDGEGGLAGLLQWASPDSQETGARMVDARDLRAFVASNREASGKDLDDRPVLGRSFPDLAWPSDSAKASSAVKPTVNRFVDGVGCSTCGKLGYKVKYISEENGRRRTQREERTPCSACGEDCIVASRELWDCARVLAAVVSKVALDSDDVEDVQRWLEESLRATALLNPLEFRRRLRDSAIEELARPVPGRAVLFLVDEELWPERAGDAWSEDVRLLESDAYGPLNLVHPAARNVRREGGQVAVFGTIAGAFLVDDVRHVVLDRVLAVPLHVEGMTTGR